MAGRGHVTALSALLASLGLSGAVMLAAAPFVGSSANAATGAARGVVVAGPTQVDPDEPGGQPEPVVTVTITETPGQTAQPSEGPTVTVTTTVTPSPKTTKTTKTTKAPVATATATVPTRPVAPPVEAPPPQSVDVPPAIEPSAPSEPEVELPPVPSPADTPTSSPFDETALDSIPIEVRNASPEFDQVTLSRQLGIPALVLVLLVLFAVLIFEGRLRRVAHAAAVRRAGPQSGRHRVGGVGEYPAGHGYAPGYTTVAYQSGPAYAPIISFVPVQTYPVAPAGPVGYGQPGHPQQGYPMGPGHTGYDPAYGTAPTAPAYGTAPTAPASGFDAPQGTDEPSRSAAPAEDSPWQRPGSAFPAAPPYGEELEIGASGRHDRSTGPGGPERAQPGSGLVTAGPEGTAVYPLPGAQGAQGAPEENSGEGKRRGLLRRRKN